MLINELSNLAMEGRLSGRGLGGAMRNRLESLAAMNKLRSGKKAKKRRSPRRTTGLGASTHLGRGKKKGSKPRKKTKKKRKK